MDEVLTQLHLLVDCIVKKIQMLEHILVLTNEQTELIISSPNDNTSFSELVRRKKEYIEKANDLDSIFTDIYERIKDYMGKGNIEHRQPMLDLQAHITTVAELTVKIKTIEEKNARLLTGGVRKPPKKLVSTSSAVSAYKKSNKKF